MMKTMIGAAAALGLLAAGAADAQTPVVPPPSDWGQALREDAQAFHDIIADSHPGPVDVENPGFDVLLERGLQTALTRAETADSYADWYFALQEYSSSFDDGHLGLTSYRSMGHVWSSQWPGFLTGLRSTEAGDRHEVVFNRDPAAPPIGAVLTSCDSRPAEAVAGEMAGRAAGRWSLRSRRMAYAATVFIDQTNPWVRRPERCVFTVDGAERTYDLVWRDLPAAVRTEGFAAANTPRFTTAIGLRDWGGGVWIDLGGFNGDPQGTDGLRLTPLKAELAARVEEIRAAPVVVFDLRGNNGGSSAWINAMAETLWGESWVKARKRESTAVDWRASDANIEMLEGYRAQVANDPVVSAWLQGAVTGMSAARAAGRPLWTESDEAETAPPAVSPPNPMRGRVYVFTDYGCASACLDAVDVLKAVGAVQIGQETSADTVYMEVREAVLPSGRADVRVPVKVYRGRARGNNETAVPVHHWTGALSDTAGIEAWIAGLDAGAPDR